ncbi:MAG: ATP-binding cassette domain-containing protein [Elusimicrobiota bacterium]
MSLPRGQCLGLVGPNAAGKSTLLLLLAELLAPTEGSVSVRGTVSPFFNIGTGLYGELSVRDNIGVLASLFALTNKELSSCFPDIVSFGSLESYLDARLNTLSAGFQARVAFSTALHSRAEVLLIDEIFAVGDAAFRAQCLERMTSLRQAGKTFVLASHDLSLIRSICTQAIYLEKGLIAARGEPKAVTAAYERRRAHQG